MTADVAVPAYWRWLTADVPLVDEDRARQLLSSRELAIAPDVRDWLVTAHRLFERAPQARAIADAALPFLQKRGAWHLSEHTLAEAAAVPRSGYLQRVILRLEAEGLLCSERPNQRRRPSEHRECWRRPNTLWLGWGRDCPLSDRHRWLASIFAHLTAHRITATAAARLVRPGARTAVELRGVLDRIRRRQETTTNPDKGQGGNGPVRRVGRGLRHLAELSYDAGVELLLSVRGNRTVRSSESSVKSCAKHSTPARAHTRGAPGDGAEPATGRRLSGSGAGGVAPLVWPVVQRHAPGPPAGGDRTAGAHSQRMARLLLERDGVQ